MTTSQKLGIAFRSYGTAHKFISKHRLWHFVIIPGILNIILFYVSFNWFVDSVAGWVTGIFDMECEDGVFSVICYLVAGIADLLEFFVFLSFLSIPSFPSTLATLLH